MLERTIENGMFGSITIAADTGKATLTIPGGAEGQLLDYTLRESGMQKTLINNDKITKAITAPSIYFMKKQLDLIKVGNHLNSLFKVEYERQLDAGESEEQARKLTIDHLAARKAELLAQHEIDFPKTISDAIVKRRLRAGKDGGIPPPPPPPRLPGRFPIFPVPRVVAVKAFGDI